MFGQDAFERYREQVDASLREYQDARDENFKQVVQQKLLNENIATIFNTLVFGSSDVTTNASGFGYVQDTKKSTLAANANIPLGASVTNTRYVRIGAATAGSGTILDIYDDEAFLNQTSANIGFIAKFWGSSRYIPSNIDTLQFTHGRRKLYAYDAVYNKDIYNIDVYRLLQELQEKIESRNPSLTNDQFVNQLNGTEISRLFNLFPRLREQLSKGEYDEAYVNLETLRKKIGPYKCLEDMSSVEMEDFVENTVLYRFDKQNNALTGCKIYWIDFNLNIAKNTFKFGSSNVDSTATEFIASDSTLKDINRQNISPSFTINHARNNRFGIFFIQMGIAYHWRSYLASELIEDAPTIAADENGLFLKNNDVGRLGTYEQADQSIRTRALSFYGAWLFNKRRTFGVNLALKHNSLIEKPADVYYENNFDALFGLLFRQKKKDKTAIAFGLDFGWVNALYGTKIADDLTARIRIGIPFNIYE